LEYFGKATDDPRGERALQEWLDEKENILAGRPRGSRPGEGILFVHQLCNHFLTSKKHACDAGEITARTYADYKATTDRLVAFFGKRRAVTELTPQSFGELRANIATSYGPTALGNEIQRIRSVFKYGHDTDLIDKPVKFGPSFKRPSRKVMRLNRAKAGQRMFEASEIRALLAKARPKMRAMILLGINCGFGNADCAALPISAVNLKTGWVTFPRPKTGIARRCALWKETVAALRAAIKRRREPSDSAHAGLLFVTKQGGSFLKDFGGGPVAGEFGKTLKAAGISRNGRGFYALRHSFRTVADSRKDFPAVDLAMGHGDETMGARYRERIDDERLIAVATLVRDWLFPGNKGRIERLSTKHNHKM